MAQVHHHGAEVTDIGHRVSRHIGRNAFVFAQFIIGIGEDGEQFGGLGVNDLCTVDGEPEFGGLFPHHIRVTKQGNVTDIPEQDDLRCPQDALFGALRKDDVFSLQVSPF